MATEAQKPAFKQITPDELSRLDLTKYWSEQKLDGMLTYAVISAEPIVAGALSALSVVGSKTRVTLFSDRMVNNTSKYPHIVKQLSNIPGGGTILVGEIYIENGNVFDVNTKANYEKAKYAVFDIIQHEGVSVKDRPIEERRELVKSLIRDYQGRAMDCNMPLEGDWDMVVKHNWEGLVLKPKGSKYGVGWLKCKRLNEVKLEIKAHDPKENNSKGAFILEGGNRCDALSPKYLEQFMAIKAAGKTPMGELEYALITKDGKLFQPRLRQIFSKEI